ncbi:MAG: cobalamin biosynthesis protein CbiD [Clostridia bacterium]|nr:cobalamin biosynthesis protein CbiD [Clostridia bacterium]
MEEILEESLVNREGIVKSSDLGTVWQNGRFWRKGITTGTCATAGAKAALKFLLTGEKVSEVAVRLPSGQLLMVPVKDLGGDQNTAWCTVIKDGGDDPDITTGLPIVAQVQVQESREIQIVGGPGVGQVTKPGLPVPPGQAAINPVPRKMIKENVREVLGRDLGAIIKISVPGGEKIALKTLNPQLGIIGGISILGTSGIVEPMSEEAFKDSLAVRVRQIKALGADTLVLVPGKIGEKAAVEKYNISPQLIALMSNFVGFMLEQAQKEGFQEVLILGHLGKTVKLSAGIFHTHSRQADGRLETMAAYLGTLGATGSLIQEVLDQTTTEGAVTLIKNAGFSELFEVLAEKGEKRCKRFLKTESLEIGLVMTDMQGNPLGISSGAKRLGGKHRWHIR